MRDHAGKWLRPRAVENFFIGIGGAHRHAIDRSSGEKGVAAAGCFQPPLTPAPTPTVRAVHGHRRALHTAAADLTFHSRRHRGRRYVYRELAGVRVGVTGCEGQAAARVKRAARVGGRRGCLSSLPSPSPHPGPTRQIMQSFRDADKTLPVEEQVAQALKRCGMSVLYTSVTDTCAFGLGALSTVPAISYFCS